MSEGRISRRELLAGAGVVAAGAAVGCASLGKSDGAAESSRKPVLTIAHLTDIHVKPEGIAEAGMRACLRHVHALNPRPDVIFNGGDSIMDALGATAERTQKQWDLWHKILAEECTIPMENCIGNHDNWGWQKTKAQAKGDEPLYGVKWALKEFGLTQPYRSWDKAGWHFIVLNSCQERGDEGYKPVLDEEQFAWLEADLAANPDKPILILSHVPIISGSIYFFTKDIVKDYQFKLIGALMHQDVHRLKNLFYKHKNIKLCLSGHMHLRDRVDYNGITYLGNGSVCGNWWGGTFGETPGGYGLVRLYADGTWDNEYVLYPYPEVPKKG